MNWYYYEITFLMIFAIVIMMFIVSKNNLLSRKQKRSLLQLYFLLIFSACLEWMGYFLNGKASNTMMFHAIVKALEYSTVPFLCIQLLRVIELEKKNRWLYALVGTNVLFQFASIVTELSFYIDEKNVYRYGSLNWIYTVLCLFCSIYTMIKCFMYGKHFQSSSRKTSIALVLLLVTGIGMKNINPSVQVELLCVSFIAIFMYIYYVDILQKSDPLTRLLNRSSYISKLSDISSKVAIVYFDVDQFKEINDNYGHMYGDEVLHIVGQTLKEVYAKHGSCYRIGGDEFCVVLEKRIDDIEDLNQNFEHSLDKKRKTEKNLPTVSVGYSVFDPSRDKIEEAVSNADKNMYRTKTKLRKALKQTNMRLLAMVQAFQIAAEESSTLVFIYNLETESILVDERTAKAFGVAEKQAGVPYETAKMGMVSEDTVDEYIRIHEEMLHGAAKATGVVKLIQADGTESLQNLSFRAVFDDEGNPTGDAVGIYSNVLTEE